MQIFLYIDIGRLHYKHLHIVSFGAISCNLLQIYSKICDKK